PVGGDDPVRPGRSPRLPGGAQRGGTRRGDEREPGRTAAGAVHARELPYPVRRIYRRARWGCDTDLLLGEFRPTTGATLPRGTDLDGDRFPRRFERRERLLPP